MVPDFGDYMPQLAVKLSIHQDEFYLTSDNSLCNRGEIKFTCKTTVQ